jgi:hypothetical protein
VLDIIEIVRDPSVGLIEGVDLAAQPIDLGPAGDARLDAMSMEIFLDGVAIEAIARLHRNRMRPRTDQRHIALQHIDQLWQLIEAQPTQNSPNAGNPRVVPYCSQRSRLVAAVNMHSPKFKHLDHVVVQAEALLRK